jgi:uncharacterized protein
VASKYRARLVDNKIADRLGSMGAVVIEGPKACGKTLTARQVAASEVLLDVDPAAMATAEVDARLLLRGAAPRLIDEWQRVPQIWDGVRRAVDDRGEPGQFILTGSATPNDDVIRHSGAGRMSILRMRPMSLFEQGISVGQVSLRALRLGEPQEPVRSEVTFAQYVERILIGGWPQLLDRGLRVAASYNEDYVENTIEHDIVEMLGVRRDPQGVRRFLQAYAQVTAHPAQLSTMVRRAQGESEPEPGPSRWAAEPYLRALQRLMVIDEVPAWAPAVRSKTRLIGVPKRHLVDPSLAASLLDCDSRRLSEDLTTTGFLFESLATRDIRIYAEALGAKVYHYRERSGDLEADLIVEWTDGQWIGIEVKLGGGQVERAAAALLRLAERRIAKEPQALVVVTATEYGYQRPDGVWVLPLAVLGP